MKRNITRVLSLLLAMSLVLGIALLPVGATETRESEDHKSVYASFASDEHTNEPAEDAVY